MTSRVSLKAVCVGLLLVLLSGCDSRFQAQTLFEAYLSDLNRSDWLNIEPIASPDFIPLPPLRTRQLALSQFDVGLLDFLSLQSCDVGSLAGQRNSILGKVMPTSQRLVYELDMIRAIRECSIEDEALRDTLSNVADVKTKELPRAFSNALWAGDETQAFFSLAKGYIPVSPESSRYQQLVIALQDLTSIAEHLDSIPEVSSKQIERDMQAIFESEYLGKLLFSLGHISRYLTTVSEHVVELSRDESVCGAPLRFLKKQFEAHYIDQLQPYMARINRVAYQVLPLMSQLVAVSDQMEPSWRTFTNQFSMQHSDSLWQQYLQASRDHGQAWSNLFAKCNSEVT